MSLGIALSRNPLTDALLERSIDAGGLDYRAEAIPVMELFARTLAEAPYDVAEFSLANYIMALSQGDRRYVGLPVFPFRGFRHSMLWVRADGDIAVPQDLRGRRVGIAGYAMTAILYVTGLLEEEYGVAPREIAWLRMGHERIAFTPPPGLQLVDAPGKASLFDRLRAGEVDAVITFWSPQAEVGGVRRLFQDVFATEADFYRRTGIYPIMHMMALRRELYEREPALAARLCRLFVAAKRRWSDNLVSFGAESASVTPWTPLDLERARAVLGPELYPYGVAPNEKTLAAMLRYTSGQGLLQRPVALDELFAPEAVAALAAEGQ